MDYVNQGSKLPGFIAYGNIISNIALINNAHINNINKSQFP